VTAVQSCKGCGKLFAFLPRGLCADCIDVREERFQTVREWLRDNRGASVIAACQATGVEERLVAEFIREGRLEFSGATESVKDQQAREALRAKLVAEMSSQAPAPAPPPSPRRGMNVRHS
jgi:hypothetical protein